MSNEWNRIVARFRDDLTREISATPTGERRNILCDIQLELMRVEDLDKAVKTETHAGGN